MIDNGPIQSGTFLRFPFVLLLIMAGCGAETTGSIAPYFDAPAEVDVADAVATIAVDWPYSMDEVSTDAEGHMFLRTQIEILFRPTAIHADLEDLLSSIDATITSAMTGVAAVVVRIPDPGSLEELDRIVADIEAEPAVWFVRRAELPTPRALPSTATPGEPQSELHHHLAVRAHAAWNVRGAAAAMPHVIVADGFGGGPPNALDAELTPSQFGTTGPGPLTALGIVCLDAEDDDCPAGFSCPPPSSESFCNGGPPPSAHWHGYHVSGIIAADFGGPNTPQGRATGILPVRSRLDVADSSIAGPLDVEYRALQLAESGAGPAVLNVSLGWSCGGQITNACHQRARQEGGAWAYKVRSAGLEDRLLIVAAGGNIDSPSIASPTMPTSSMLIAAAVRDDLIGPSGDAIARLTNTLAVTAVRTAPNPEGAAVERVQCLADWSFVGGDVSAVGEQVYSIVEGEEARAERGTSMSAPQVAGLGAYVFAVRPDLTAPEVRQLLIETAAPVGVSNASGCSDYQTPAPSIDAYAALLALDTDLSVTPIRRALLDRDDDGGVDADDIIALLAEIEEADGELDYGRADLNGDGRTGGPAATPFDLNANGVADDLVSILIDEELRELDEGAVSDLDLLCYYAYSLLFDAPGSGQSAVEQACRPQSIDVTLEFPSSVPVGLPATLTVTVLDGDASVLDATVEVTAQGTTESGAVGTTINDGTYSHDFVAAEGASEVELLVTSTAANGEVLDQRTVVAPVGPSAVQLIGRLASAFVRARVLAGQTFVDTTDEDRDQTPVFSDTTALATKSESAGESSGSGNASGTATASVTHQTDDGTGDLTRIDVVLDSQASASYGGEVSGYAQAYANADVSYLFTVSRPQTLSYDVSLGGGSTATLLSFSLVEERASGRIPIESTGNDGGEGPQVISGAIELVPGSSYRLTVGTSSTPAQNEAGLGIPSASAQATATFLFESL